MEVETVGRSSKEVADAVLSVVGGELEPLEDPDVPQVAFWSVRGPDGRTWKVVDDESLEVPAGNVRSSSRRC